MAHTKAGGAAKRTVDVAGKRLGIKKFGGESVIAGNIILRQKGTHFHPGVNTMLARDFTIFATAPGTVSFRHMTGHKRAKKFVDVVPQAETKATQKTAAVKAETTEAEAKPAKKAAPKKAAAKK